MANLVQIRPHLSSFAGGAAQDSPRRDLAQVARVLENKISHLFENFQAGKNATSSLIKGEGVATDLRFNRAFINNMLPRAFVTESATCKQLKWQVAAPPLGACADPRARVLSSMHRGRSPSARWARARS
jgi:hypothetical protein